LLYPKLPISEDAGILLGEILLIVFPMLCLVAPRQFRFSAIYSSLFLTFLCFLSIYILFSSLFSYFITAVFPVTSLGTYIRVLLYVQISILVNALCIRDASSTHIYKLILGSYLIHILAAVIYFAYAFHVVQPTLGDILGNASAGNRVIPFYGLTIQTNAGLPLNSFGGGSGNLLASHALFVLILASKFQRNSRLEMGLLLFTIVVLLLAQSRGGTLTILLWSIWRFRRFFLLKFSFSLMSLAIASTSVACLSFFLYYLSTDLGLFIRFGELFAGESLDGSSKARLDNYGDVFRAWSSNLYFIMFGLGFDKEQLQLLSDWTIVESLYLSVLFCSGVLGMAFLLVFLLDSYRLRNKTIWSQTLFSFLVFNSIINWSITGGDLLGAPSLFFCFLAIGLHVRETNYSERMKARVLC